MKFQRLVWGWASFSPLRNTPVGPHEGNLKAPSCHLMRRVRKVYGMRAKLGYDLRMQDRVLAAIVVLVVSLAVSAQAQTGPGTANGVPPSVTSFGFGGHAGPNGPPASVTTSGWERFPRPIPPVHFHQPVQDPGHHRHHQNQLTYNYYPYYIPYFPVMDPYAYGGPVAEEASSDAEQQDQYQGGPT